MTALQPAPSPPGIGFVDTLKEAIWAVVRRILDNMGMIIGAILDALIQLAAEGLDVILEPVMEIMLYAPAPETGGQLFAPPTNAPWTRIFGPFWAAMVPLGLVILVVSYFAAELLSSVPVSSPSATRQREFGLLTGLFAIPLSRYVITLYLQTMRSLTQLLIPGDMISLSDLAAVNSGAAAIAILLLVFLSAVVYIAMLAVHVFRIVGIIMIAGAAPVLLGLYLGRFPVLDDVAKSLLRALPVLGFAPVVLALAMRVMAAIFAADGGINIDGLGVVGVVVEPLFLLAPGLLGLVLPVLLIQSVSAMAAPSAAGTSAKMSSPAAASKAKAAGAKKATQGASKAADKARDAPSRVKTKLQQRRIRQDVGNGDSGGDDDTGATTGQASDGPDDGPPSEADSADRTDGEKGDDSDAESQSTAAGATEDSEDGEGNKTEMFRGRDPVSRARATDSSDGEMGFDQSPGTGPAATSAGDITRGATQADVEEALSERFGQGTNSPTDSDDPADSATDS